MKKILIVGSGGREHAIVRSLVSSERNLYVAPGNAGTEKIAQNVDIEAGDISRLADFVQNQKIDFTIIGPENPLGLGVVDEIQARGHRVFGPSKEAARLETSKAWAARFQEKFNIPSPKSWIFKDYREARQFIEFHPISMVVKPDGLTGGKGVQVCKAIAGGVNKQALQAARRMLVDKEFGSAGQTIVIQEFLGSEETTVMAFSDGVHVVSMIPAQDYKELNGRMTGGMGSRAPFGTPEMVDNVYRQILVPTIDGMREIGLSYKGVIYAGLMLTKDGPKVLEFNCRFGDPETQVVLPLLKSDLLSILEACVDGKLDEAVVGWRDEACVCVVLASESYPERPILSREIYGIEEFERQNLSDVWLIHAGTKKENGIFLTSGGRVIGVCALGRTMKETAQRVYSFIPRRINFEGMQYKDDIG